MNDSLPKEVANTYRFLYHLSNRLFLLKRSVEEQVGEIESAINMFRREGTFKHKYLHEIFYFSTRTANCLKKQRIETIDELLSLSADDLLKIDNFGEKSLKEIREILAAEGMYLSGEKPKEETNE